MLLNIGKATSIWEGTLWIYTRFTELITEFVSYTDEGRCVGKLLLFCYIITEWFFYINHFSLIIFYQSVWLSFELFDS